MSSETAMIAQLSIPSHSCLIYRSSDEQTEVTSEFLARGLMRGEQCIFLEAPERTKAVRDALERTGVNVAEEEARGALVLSSDRNFLAGGQFEGARTIAFLGQTLQQALTDGFSALRVTGDMNWELGDDQNFQILPDYEAELDRYVSRHRIIGMCQYRRHSLSGLAIRNALETHQNVILGRSLCRNNLYYEPPEIRLERNFAEAQERRVEWMCGRLEQAMRAERQRDSAMNALLKDQDRPSKPSNP